MVHGEVLWYMVEAEKPVLYRQPMGASMEFADLNLQLSVLCLYKPLQMGYSFEPLYT